MHVHPGDARCRVCGEDLRIVDASDDDTLVVVECESCAEIYDIKADVLNDGTIHYLRTFLGRRSTQERED